MAATALTKSDRYFRAGITEVYWVKSIADYNAPTRTELDAGTDLSCEVASLSGWEVTSETADAPDLCSRFVSQVPAQITASDSSITLYADSTSNDARSLMDRNEDGHIVIFWEGDVATQLMDVFPSTVRSVGKSSDIQAVATLEFQYAITAEPATDVAIPS